MKLYSSDRVIAYLALFSGLSISAVAVYYSVAGLIAIFAAAAIPIMIMGVVLEISKLVASVWLKQNWDRAPKGLKWYLASAVVVLMIITSMGIFGFLSKAHLDQNLVSGDVVDRVAILDEKIKTQKDNIEAARKALRQMDEAVDQTMSRSNDEKGADKAAGLRRSQQRERTNLQNDIAKSQSEIAKLNEERAPIAKDLRAVEAEVGPIKYIAKLIYGDSPDTNLLEKAVTWVIMIIIFVFDPLAVLLLLASQYSFQWLREKSGDEEDQQAQEFFDKVREIAVRLDNEAVNEFDNSVTVNDPHPPGWMFTKSTISGAVTDPKLWGFDKNTKDDELSEEQAILDQAIETEKQAMQKWKQENPNNSLKIQKKLLERGKISELPWTKFIENKIEQTEEQEAALEAAKWAQEQLDKDVSWMEHDEQGNQIKKTKESYQQNAEQNERTIWQRIQDAKK